VLTLTVEFVNGFTRRLRYLTGCVLDGSGHLISDSFTGQSIISGSSAQALLEPAGESSSGTGEALFRSPQRGSASGILHVVISGRIPRTRLVKDNVRRHGDAYVRIPAEADQHSWLKAITIPV
jgi:hypothetical protein